MENIKNIIVDSWEQFIEIMTAPEYRSWAFRGHAHESWPLLSTLSRYLNDYNVHPEAWPSQEARILRIFKRKSHLILTHNPAEDDSFQWLALMQHHGTPTRLLDFTWSPYVAIFFAIERAIQDAAVWAVFPPGLSNTKMKTIRTSQKIEDDEIGPWVIGNYEKYFLKNKNELIVIGEPHQMNRRLVAQSGTFIVPGVLDKPVDQLISSDSIVKFTLKTDKIRKKAMRELYNMNIGYATLFPDLDGLARSLAYELEFHWAFDPVTNEQYNGFYVE